MKNNLPAFPGGKMKAVTLSYDDGTYEDIRMIETLKKHGMKCTFNLISAFYTDTPPEKMKDPRPSADEIVDIYDPSMCEIATHCFSHPFLQTLPESVCLNELAKGRSVLEDIFGTVIRGHAYPYGGYNDTVVNIARSVGLVYARTTVSHHSFQIPSDWLRMGATCHHKDPLLPELTDRFLNNDLGRWEGGRLFYLWGHSFEFEHDGNWDVLEKFCEQTGGRDDVWYATNIEIYDYMTAYKNLIYSFDGSKVYNPSVIDVWIKVFDDIIRIPSGQTVNIK